MSDENQGGPTWTRIGLTAELYTAEKEVSDRSSEAAQLRTRLFNVEHGVKVWTERRDELLAQLVAMANADQLRSNPTAEDEADVAIAALSPGNDLGLLDENPAAVDTEVRNKAEGEAWHRYVVKGGEDYCDYATLAEAEAAFAKLTSNPDVADAALFDRATLTVREYKAPPSPDPDVLLENQPGVSSQASSGEAEIPEGFTKWGGDTFPEAIRSDDCVEILLRSGGRETGFANEMDWEHSPTHTHPNDIIAYLVFEAAAGEERIEVVSEPQTTTESAWRS